MANLKDVRSSSVRITLNDGVERELSFTLNAMAELEDKYGSVDAAFKAVEANSMKALRFVLWAGLSHSDENLTEQQVGNLIDIQRMHEISAAMEQAFGNDMPDKNEGTLPNA